MDNNVEELIKEAIEDFCGNPYWKKIYDDAPGKAKRYYALTFTISDAAPFGEDVLEKVQSMVDEEIDSLYCSMNDEEWDYVLANASGPSKMGLGQARKEMQGKPIGTRYGSWRQ